MRFIIDGVSVPRATNKKDLIEMANQAFKDLQQLISNMSVAEQAASFCFDVTKMGNEAH